MKRTIGKVAAIVAAAGLLLTGCSKADEPAEGDRKDAGTVSIAHAWGTDEYPVKPAKVVASGVAVDNLLALGVTPDVVIETPADKGAPWRAEALKGVERIDAPDFRTVPVEKIAAAKPDFIVGDFWRITQENYTNLKEIAPTLGGIGAEGESLGWKPQLEALGKIYGKEGDAKKVIDEDAGRFDSVKSDLPKLEGKTGVLAQYAPQRGMAVVADPEEPGNSAFYDLGMKVPDSFASLPQRSGRAEVSPENISVIDADFMAVYAVSGGPDEIRAIPGFSDLRQVKNDTTVFGDVVLVMALNNPSSLSRAWVLEQLRPTLEKVAKQ